MKKKIGIITYHSAYNFGSVLQAYATQQVIESLGHMPSIINYRMKSQYEYYKTIHIHQGIKHLVKDLFLIPVLGKYKLRRQRYETFISDMNITEEISEPEGLEQFAESFDLYISGSDQIWNKHSNELKDVEWKYMWPYLLEFTSKEKISYASSIVNMSDAELKHIAEYLKSFSRLSCRERESSKRISDITMKPCENVIDPTLLLNATQWEKILGEIPEQLKEEKYILYYALEGIKKTSKAIPHLKKIAKKMNCKLVMITPLSPIVTVGGVINAVEAGPKEFLRLIKNAEFVITNSYHGTLFSLNLNKRFYSICEKDSEDKRIWNILHLLGLEKYIRYSIEEIDFENNDVCFEKAMTILALERKKSLEYLEQACND